MKVRGGGRFPNLDRWFDALEQRPAYLGTRSDYFTHVHDLPPQIGGASHSLSCTCCTPGSSSTSTSSRKCRLCAGCTFLPEAEEYAAAIDGTDGRSWYLPLEPLTSTSLEAYSLGACEQQPCAAARRSHAFLQNHATVSPSRAAAMLQHTCHRTQLMKRALQILRLAAILGCALDRA